MLYFRNVAAVADDDNAEDSACWPTSSLLGMQPSGNSELRLQFKPLMRPVVDASGAADSTGNLPNADTVLLNLTTANTHRAVMLTIMNAINAHPHSSGLVVVADDAVDDTNGAATYLSGIATCGTITHNGAFTN